MDSRLTPIRPAIPGRTYRWLFLCECGVEVTQVRRYVETGQVRSCGCLRRENGSRQRRARLIASGHIEPDYDAETPADTDARVSCELAAGTRCARCYLLGHAAEGCDLRERGKRILEARIPPEAR